MKNVFLWVIIGAFLLIFLVYLYVLLEHRYTTLESQIGVNEERLSQLDIKPKTGDDEEKIKLATQLAEANSKLINTDIDKLKLELKDSNQKWLWGLAGYIGMIVAIVVAITGVALWFVVKSLIADRVENSLNGFKESVEKVNILESQVRILEREQAASMLADPENDDEDEGYIYPDTIMSLSEQTLLDVLNFQTYHLFTRIRAAEMLKKRDPIQSLPILLEFVNSILDTHIDNIDKYGDIDQMWNLSYLVSLFKDIHSDETYIGLSNLLTRVQKLEDDSELKKAHLTWILFALAYVGDALNEDKSVPNMKEAVPFLYIDLHQSNHLLNLVLHFERFNEIDAIKDILSNHGTTMASETPDVKEKCLTILQEHCPEFVEGQEQQK